jgi:RNA polymerase sigma-70 factor (ECF subfamily)
MDHVSTPSLMNEPGFGMILLQQNSYVAFMDKLGSLLMYQTPSDGDLIRRYLDYADERAFERLMRRHYDSVYHRLLSHCKHPQDAEDMTQQLWVRVVNNLASYADDGRFSSFLMRATSNILTDYWRRKGVKDQVIQQVFSDEDTDAFEMAPDPSIGVSTLHEVQDQVSYLIRKLIPELTCEQRLAFLLMHESEHWEEKRRLGWQHLADLNGIDAQEAWNRFEAFRNKLLQQINGHSKEEPDCDSLLIFLIWTQSQRLEKRQSFTWDYFAEVLGVSVNTLKGRYRTALKKLAQELKDAQ